MANRLRSSLKKKIFLPLILILILLPAVHTALFSLRMQKKRNTPEHKAALEYLTTSEAFQKINIPEGSIQLRQFNEGKSRCKADHETKRTMKYGFYFGKETIEIVGHSVKDHFIICPECSAF